MNASQFRLLRTLAVRGLALGLLAAGTHVFAQTAPAAKSDPRVLMGGFHPERMQPTTLAPHVAPVIVTPPENIPLNRLQAQPGFQIELWAHGSPGARMMTRGDKGTVFQGTRNIGRVYAIYEKDGKHVSKIIVEKLVQPNGVLFHKGSLYVVAINRVLRYDNIEANLENIPAPVDMTEDFKLPPEVHHNITTGNSSPWGLTARSTCRSARRATCANSIRACMAISAVTISTARAWKSWRAACAIPSALISI